MYKNSTAHLLACLLLVVCSAGLRAQSVSYTDLYDNSTFARTIDLSKPVGVIEGSAGTTPSGGASYTIPIKCPPGTHGMVPNLSIVYNSQSGNGLLGQGWNLSGLSVITRAGADHYHDGKAAPVTYTDNDAFSLDGMRLYLKGGSYGIAGATYSTEEESYSVVSSFSAGGSDVYFNVVLKDGTVMQYGGTADSRFMSDDGTKTMMWRINKIRDNNGNYVQFIYDNSGRDSRIKEVKYTGNEVTSLSPYMVVTFNYGTRDDKNTYYNSGNSIKTDHLLTSINISEIGTSEVFKSYSFSYGKNNLVSYLKAVNESNALGETINDTRFKYGSKSTEAEVKESNINLVFTTATSPSSINHDIFSGDFDGDGKTEILKADYNYVGGTTYYDRNYLDFAVLKQGSVADNYSFMSGSLVTLPTTSDAKYFVCQRNRNVNGKNFIASDFNGDGRDDLLFMNITTDVLFNGVSIYYSNLGTSSPGFDRVDIPPAALSGTHQMIGENIILMGDFDGDGRSDYMYMTEHIDPGTGYAYTHTFVSFPGKGENNRPIMLESSPSSYDQRTTALLRNAFGNSKVYVVDFDGDGISELMCSLVDDNFIFKLAKTSSGVYYFKEIVWSHYPTERYQEIKGLGDFNGDGKTDFIVNSKADRSVWEIAYATGTDFSVVPFSFASGSFQRDCEWSTGSWPSTSTTTAVPDALYIGDYNGDGKSDILHIRKYCNPDYENKTDFNYYYFVGKKGNTYSDIIHEAKSFTHLSALSDVVSPILTDVNGDGKCEFSFKNASASGTYSAMQTLYFRKDDRSNVLEKVADGFNRIVEFSYQPLTNGTGSGSFYAKGSGDAYPLNNIQAPIYVVTSLKQPDGIGGVNETEFRYENLRLHRAGRGLLGFQAIKSFNATTNIRTEILSELNSGFYLSYPKTTKTFLLNTGALLTQSDATVNFERIGSTDRFVRKEVSSSVQDFQKGITTTTNNTFDADGNISQSITTTSGGPETLTTTVQTSFVAAGSSPVPCRPAEIITTTKRGTKAAISMKNWIAYYPNGNIKNNTTAPVSLPIMYIRDYFEYDAYGNVTKTSKITPGDNLPTVFTYDSRGRFRTSEENDLTHDKKYMTTHNFWGTPLSFTGTNGLTTVNTYDSWGKLISTDIPTSTSSHYTVTYSDSWDISGSHMYFTHMKDPSAPDVKTWKDVMDRPVKTMQETFNGAWTTSNTTYDARGNIKTVTQPYLPAETPMTTTNVYDDQNRLSTVTDPFGGTTNYTYSASAGVAIASIASPDGKVKTTKTDALGKVLESSNGVDGGTVVFTYDSRGNELTAALKISGTDRHDFIVREYEEWGRLKKIKDHDAGTTSYTYDFLGRIIQQVDPKGKITFYTYDIMGHPTRKELDGYITDYEYYSKDKDYRLKSQKVTGPDGIVEDRYDYAVGGGMTSWERDINGLKLTKQYSYDSYNRPLTIDYPVTMGASAIPAGSGFKKRNHYDDNGFLTKITTNYYGGGTGDKLLYEAKTKNGLGQITEYKRVDGRTATIDYYNGMPLIYSIPGVQDLKLTWNYDNGNLLIREDRRVGGLKEIFTYDAADRLTQVDASTTSLSYPPMTMSYSGSGTLSGYGRMLSKSDVGTYKYGSFPFNAVKSVSDPAGIISHETQDVVYNPFFKTKSIKEHIGSLDYEERFVYDAAEDRTYSKQTHTGSAGTTIARERWYMDGYEMQKTPAGIQYIHYIDGDAGLVGMVVSDGSAFSYYAVTTDHLGSIIRVDNEYHAVVTELRYDAWGKETATTPRPSWLYRGYTGHEMLPEYGLINMNSRMYDPLNGRMLRPDNNVTYPYNSQSYNRYSYALNNPLKYIDPDGNDPVTAAILIGMAVSTSLYTVQVARSPGGFDNWNWTKFTWAAVSGAVSGLMGYGIGSTIGSISGTVQGELLRAGLHGYSSYVMSGGNRNAVLGAAFGSLAGSFGQEVGGALNTDVGGTLFAGAVGGTSSFIGGGNFWEGAATGATVHMVNQVLHKYKTLPSFKKLWSNYPPDNPDGSHAHPSKDGYKNQCAIRMGYTFKKSGENISSYDKKNQTTEGYPRWSKGFAKWIAKNYGPPIIMSQSDFEAAYSSGQGIIYLDPPQGGIGHIDLYYQGKTGSGYYLADKVWFWPVK